MKSKSKKTVRNPDAIYKSLDWIPGYKIGSDGSFISLEKVVPCFKKGEENPYKFMKRSEQRIKIHVTANGAGCVSYKVNPYIDGERHGLSTARLVLLAHKGNPPTDERYLAWSLNRDSSNANIFNLAWVLASDTILTENDNGIKTLKLKEGAVLH